MSAAGTKATHTPGPWEIGHLGDHGSFEIGVGYQRPGMLSYDGFVIAARSAVEHKAEEMRANARLIAAAPELLDALKDALAELSPLMQAYRAEHHADICGRARAAIAKAEGGPAADVASPDSPTRGHTAANHPDSPLRV